MPTNEMLDEMLDQAVKRIQHSIQHSKTKFVFDLDQTSSNINLQMLDDPTWVVKRIQHFIQHWFLACWMKCWMRLTRALDSTKYVEDLCKKANQKLHALARLSNYMDPVKLKLLMDAFIRLQFNYCPLVWMFHDRTINSKVNKIRERALRIVCKDSGNDFLNAVNNSVTTHQRNLQLLMIEIFKTKNDLNPTFMKDVFTERDNYHSLRNINHFQLPKVRTRKYGTENIQYRGCLLWASLKFFERQ